MAKITGVPTLYRVTRILCIAVAKFRPLIYRLYPSNTALHVALEAASVACGTFMTELDAVRDYGD